MSDSSRMNAEASSSNAADTLRGASFSRNDGPAAVDAPVTASDLLNTNAFDPSRLHPMAAIGDKLDYLLLEDDKTSALPGAGTPLPTRGWNDDLCYGTGTTYLAGLGVGGLWGFREGAFRPLAVSTPRLRINSILNSVTRRGTFIGNSAGVLALIYNGIGASIDAYRGEHDQWGSMAAGAITGALFKSTAGIKPMFAAATLMTGLAGGWSWLKTVLV
ncbi:Mitochondrial import inner membrane translocase subunit tim23 [Tulasnella sp. 427]|nr:Mitochondrial import inner membrane translocase subunit tim23 [Tulasnella sp. 427]